MKKKRRHQNHHHRFINGTKDNNANFILLRNKNEKILSPPNNDVQQRPSQMSDGSLLQEFSSIIFNKTYTKLIQNLILTRPKSSASTGSYFFFLSFLHLMVILHEMDSISSVIYDGVSEFQVIEGDAISLPCNISTKKEWEQDRISLVVWYRSNTTKGQPIYSIDRRNSMSLSSPTLSRQQIMPEFDGRIRMDFQHDPPVLHIDRVQINDGGDYRCRVDYRMNRTKHFLIHLEVSVLPKNVVIRDLLGNVVQGKIRQPFNEGDKVSLYCDAIGGSPPPIVIWKNNDGKIIDDSHELLNNDNNLTRNILDIPQIDRSHLLQEITCEAYPPFLSRIWNEESKFNNSNSSNSNNTSSTSNKNWTLTSFQRRNDKSKYQIPTSSVVLDLNLRPLSVQIQVPNFQPNLNRTTMSSSSSGTLPSSSSSSYGFTSPTIGNVLVVSAGKKTEIECRSWGSRPPAEITWWRGSRRLPTAASRSSYNKNPHPSSDTISDDSSSSEQQQASNLTFSILTYVATPEDDGQRLTCRADNIHLEHEEIEDSVTISVRYAPLLKLSLGAKIPENIREGSDVYFECSSKSNPPLSEVVWLFEGKPLINDPVSGVLVTNQSLVMQRVRRQHRGNYQCAASNPEGISASNKVFLNVHFAPVCKPTQTIIYGVARTEHVSVSCEVESEPVTPIQFRWFFNNSLESHELPKKDYNIEIVHPNYSMERNRKFFNNPEILSQLSLENVFSTIAASMSQHDEPSVARSNLTYSPRTRVGYGLLYCMAENSVGVQRDPCVFTIVEAGPPNSVHDCRIVNVTMTSFVLECMPGENGGLRQIFHLEVYNIEKEHLQVNVTAMEEPVFAVENLPHDTAFMLNVFSSNVKGRSDSITLRTATSAYAAKHTTNEKKQKNILIDDIGQLLINPIFGALMVASFSLILLCMATIVFIRSRFCINPSENNANHPKDKIDNRDAINESTSVISDCNNKFHNGDDKFIMSHSPTMPSTSVNPFILRSQFPLESSLNQSTYYDYRPHISGPSTSLSTSDSTALTELSAVVSKHVDPSNPYTFLNPVNGSDFLPHQHQPGPSTLVHHTHYPTSASDLMTDSLCTYATSAASTIYPTRTDGFVRINAEMNMPRPYTVSKQIDKTNLPPCLSVTKPTIGCVESLSSSTSDKTDEEWPNKQHPKVNQKNRQTIVQFRSDSAIEHDDVILS